MEHVQSTTGTPSGLQPPDASVAPQSGPQSGPQAMPSLPPAQPQTDSVVGKPRVVLLTSPGLFGGQIITSLADHPGVSLVGVGLTNRVFKNTGLIGTLRKSVQRMGWPYTRLGITLGNVAWARLQWSKKPSALRRPGMSVRYLNDVNAPAAIEWLRSLQPEFIASFYFNQWIGADVRAQASRQCVNCHPSLLPDLRGPDPVFRTLQRQLTEWGISLHEVADDFDAGQILHQVRLPVPSNASYCGMYCDAAVTGSQLLGDWMSGRLPRLQLTTSGETGDYTTFPSPGDVRSFLSAGHRFFTSGEFSRQLSRVR